MRALLGFGLLMSLAPSAAGAELEKKQSYGKHLSAECTACHRLDGADVGIPSIVGRPAGELVAALKAYKEGQRTNPAMASVAQSLDEAQMEALAAYLGSLPKPTPADGLATSAEPRADAHR